MSLRAAAKITATWYEPEQDGEEKTAFHLRPLTSLQMLEVGEAINAKENSRAYRTVLRYGLIGWRNLLDDDGSQVPFMRDMEQNLARLTVELIDQLGTRVLEASRVTEDDRKNSSSPST
jgi:hypothetical protein